MKTNTIIKKEICSYTTVDGQTFKNWQDAFNHESALLSPRKIYNTTIEIPFEDSVDGQLYKINSYEDYQYLMYKEWNNYGKYCFKGPGWYIVFRYDGGDYPDSFTIYYALDYLNELKQGIETIENEMANA